MTIKITKELLDRALERYAGEVDEDSKRKVAETILAIEESARIIKFVETILKLSANGTEPVHAMLMAFALGLMVGTRMAEDGILEGMVDRG